MSKWIEQLKNVGLSDFNYGTLNGLEVIKNNNAEVHKTYSPIDSELIAEFTYTTEEEYEQVVQKSLEAFKKWRLVPAPKRGELVRKIGLELRKHKEDLARVISIEMGKIMAEALGEVQEAIDMCDFAVGLSRQLSGPVMQSERPYHKMYEQWLPLGIVGVITSFNFPMAVWAWNAMIAAIAGDTVIWKPSEKTPLCAIAMMNIVNKVVAEDENTPDGVFSLVIGDKRIGQLMAADKRIPLISATGSIPMGRAVNKVVGERLGRTILELSGNNAIILTPSANFDLAIRAIVFAAVGTAGQRCTSLRRLIIHEDIYEDFVGKLLSVYKQLEPKIGNPLDENTLIGPLIDEDSVARMQNALKQVTEEGGKILYGGEVLKDKFPNGLYVKPALVEAKNEFKIVQEETFAPILYLLKYKDIDEAIAMQNGVSQGLSSAIFSNNLLETERFLSPVGSDCGIANVNIGTSGAEIGGAFGGEKDTGGGRESGSDAWKAYMRRQTVTINYGKDLPLAQGIKFDI